MNKSIHNYVIDKLIVNWKQLNTGDAVAITEEGWSELKSKQFWRNTAIGGVITAVALPLAVPAGTISVLVPGAEIGFGLYEAGQVVVGAGVGMGLGGLGTKIAQDFAKGRIPASDILKTKGVVGKVGRIDEKIWNDSRHVEVHFYIPTPDQTYKKVTKWVDAHHLMRLQLKSDYEAQCVQEAKTAQRREERRLAEIERLQSQREKQGFTDGYAQCKAFLAHEFEKLEALRLEVNEITALQDKVTKLKSERKFHWAAHLLLPLLILL